MDCIHAADPVAQIDRGFDGRMRRAAGRVGLQAETELGENFERRAQRKAHAVITT